MATTILLIVISAVFSQNFILVKFLGICPFWASPKRPTARSRWALR